MMTNKHVFKYLGLAALVLNLNAEDVYTVDDLILKSLESSPNLKISKSNYKVSQSRYDSAFAGYLPTVDLSISAGKSGQNDTFSTTGNSDTMIDDNLLMGTLSAKQIIYDFGKTGGNVDTQKYNSEAFLNQTVQDISNKKRDVKEAYYNVLNSLALIEVQKENVKLNEAQLYRSQKYFEAGIRTKIDVSDAKVALIQSKIDLKKAQYALKLSYANLDQIAGFMALEQEYKVYSQELKLDSLYSSLIKYNLDLKESIIYAYQNKALVKKQDAQIKSSMAQVDGVTSEYYPSLYLSADYTKQSVDKFKAFIPENKWQTTVNLDWNLYEGGSTRARSQERKINVNISNDTLTDLKLNIKKDTT